MKRICKGLIVIFTVSWLTAPAYASDPCASVLCLYGKAVGQGGGSECRSAEKDFLSSPSEHRIQEHPAKTFVQIHQTMHIACVNPPGNLNSQVVPRSFYKVLPFPLYLHLLPERSDRGFLSKRHEHFLLHPLMHYQQISTIK